jgi:hypothetical protein
VGEKLTMQKHGELFQGLKLGAQILGRHLSLVKEQCYQLERTIAPAILFLGQPSEASKKEKGLLA